MLHVITWWPNGCALIMAMASKGGARSGARRDALKAEGGTKLLKALVKKHAAKTHPEMASTRTHRPTSHSLCCARVV